MGSPARHGSVTIQGSKPATNVLKNYSSEKKFQNSQGNSYEDAIVSKVAGLVNVLFLSSRQFTNTFFQDIDESPGFLIQKN